MTRSEPYHHANLRQTLLDAAVTLIGEVGPRAFTLREVARKAGVSHNAPYRHFVSKDELLAEVAAEGFIRLAASMRQIEHYQEMLGPTQGKRHITATALLQPLWWRSGPGNALPHRSGKPNEPLRSDLRQQSGCRSAVAVMWRLPCVGPSISW